MMQSVIFMKMSWCVQKAAFAGGLLEFTDQDYAAVSAGTGGTNGSS